MKSSSRQSEAIVSSKGLTRVEATPKNKWSNLGRKGVGSGYEGIIEQIRVSDVSYKVCEVENDDPKPKSEKL